MSDRIDRTRKQDGFTIVELLIATLVFTLVLLVITVGVMRFTHAYYRGINASSTQSMARTTMDDISQGIQFSGQVVKPTLTAVNGSEGFCVGTQRYSFLRGWQLEDNQVNNTAAFQNKYVFVRDTPPGGCDTVTAAQDLRGAAQDNDLAGTELLSPHMRIARAEVAAVSGAASLYRVTMRVVYGDADLLESRLGSYRVAGQDSRNAMAPDAACRNAIAGNQFCAVSQLSTTVQKRLD